MYVAPTWKDGSPPALNAAALQAISDAIVGAESKNASQDSLIAALQSAVSGLQAGKAQIEVGSYVGTGLAGSDNPNVLTLPFSPKLFFVGMKGGNSTGTILNRTSFLWWQGIEYVATDWSPNSSSNQSMGTNSISVSGKTIRWYNTYKPSNPYYQLNSDGASYFWCAIG